MTGKHRDWETCFPVTIRLHNTNHMTWLFGEENAPPDYVMEIIIDSGLARSQWMQIDRQIEQRARAGARPGQLRQLFTTLGIGSTAATALAKFAWNHVHQRINQEEGRTIRQENGTSLYNLPCGSQDSTTEEDHSNKETSTGSMETLLTT